MEQRDRVDVEETDGGSMSERVTLIRARSKKLYGMRLHQVKMLGVKAHKQVRIKGTRAIHVL